MGREYDLLGEQHRAAARIEKRTLIRLQSTGIDFDGVAKRISIK